MLEKSPALTQSDLIDIGESGSQQHLLALTKRSDIDDGLSAVLVRRSDDEVVESLLRNETAKISPETHSDIAQRAKGSEPLQSAMGRRTDVPREIMVGLFKHVSDKVRLEIKEKLTEADQKALDQVVDTMKADIEEIEATTAEQHVAELARSGALNQRVLVEFARNDKPTEFLLALAMLIKVDVATTQRLLAEETGRALAVACRASDISFDAFKTVILSPFSAAPSDLHEVMPLLRSYNQLNDKAARSTMRSWRMRKGTPEDPEQTAAPSKLAS